MPHIGLHHIQRLPLCWQSLEDPWWKGLFHSRLWNSNFQDKEFKACLNLHLSLTWGTGGAGLIWHKEHHHERGLSPGLVGRPWSHNVWVSKDVPYLANQARLQVLWQQHSPIPLEQGPTLPQVWLMRCTGQICNAHLQMQGSGPWSTISLND